MTKRSFAIGAETAWILGLGIGLGLLMGVVLSSGIAFSKADGARFIGSLFGTLIAVSGAVALFFLQESKKRRDVLEHLEFLVDKANEYCGLALKDARARSDDVDSGFWTFYHEWERLRRFCKKYEFDHYLVGEALSAIVVIDENYDRGRIELLFNTDDVDENSMADLLDDFRMVLEMLIALTEDLK